MKILEFILPVGLGGVERIISILFQYGNNQNDEVYIAIGKSYKNNFCEKFGIKDLSKVISVNDRTLWESLIGVVKIIKKIKPDVIHTHARRECFLISLANWSIRHVRTQHMAENPSIQVTWIEKRLLHRNVDVWVATSRQLADTYLRKLKYINENRIMVIYNGVNVKKKSIDHDDRRGRFCIISRLSKQKGIDILLNAIHEMPVELQKKISIDLWGEGDEKNRLLKQIDELRLSQVFTYKGVTYTPADVLVHYDALLMPSRYEGLPLTMLEAMAVKTPVAIHDVGCVGEFIITGYNGWIIDSEYTWQSFFEDVLNLQYDMKSIACHAIQTYTKWFIGDKMYTNYKNIY